MTLSAFAKDKDNFAVLAFDDAVHSGFSEERFEFCDD
jgi:hypothetical protein